MANFKTHVIAAATISGVSSIALLSLQLARPLETGGYFLLGVLGGLLPDIDSDKSTPLTVIFYFLSLYCAFAIVFNLAVYYSFAELFVIWSISYLSVRYLVFKLVTQLTVHRGVFHSLLAIVFVTLFTVDVSYYFLLKTPRVAWNAGVFLGIGYCVHLCLDELYSVDLYNKRMKKSFGTALKPFSLNNLGASLLMAGVVSLFIYYAPPATAYWQKVNQAFQKQELQKKWLPINNRWFEHLLVYGPESLQLMVSIPKK